MGSKRALTFQLVEGALAGALATVAMAAFQVRSKNFLEKSSSRKRPGRGQAGAASGDPANVKVAGLIYRTIARSSLPPERKLLAGRIVDYSFGTSLGVAFGAAGRKAHPIRNGLLYGAAVWLIADELSLWLLGVAKSPWNYPLDTHVYALASHLVYGAGLGVTMKAGLRIETRLRHPETGVRSLAA